MMVRAILVLLFYAVAPVLIIEAFKHSSEVRKFGTVLLAYAIGLVLALTGVCLFPEGSPEALLFAKGQNLFMSLTVPLAIPLMLFNCDFKLWTRALPQTVYSLVAGLVSVVTAVISGYLVFRHAGIPELEKVTAMMTGIYTGGTMNFNALGASLHVEPSVMAIVLAFEMVLTTPYIFFLLSGGYKIYRRLLPFEDEGLTTVSSETNKNTESTVLSDIEQYDGMTRKQNRRDIALGLLLSVLFLAVGAGLSLLLTGKINELVVILTITTLSLLASFFPRVRGLKKSFETGMFLILMFSVVVASLFNWHSVVGGSLAIGGFVLWIIIVASLMHLLLCRLLRVSGDLYCVSQMALLCSPPFVPPLVGAMGNKKVLISGIVIGLVGYAVGTYLGVLIFFIL